MGSWSGDTCVCALLIILSFVSKWRKIISGTA